MPVRDSAFRRRARTASCHPRLGLDAVLCASVLLLASQMSGCNPQSRLNPPETTAVLSAERIAGPGGTLLYQGKEYTGEVEVPSNALVGVLKNGEAFLYHPALGNEEPSMYNSRRAVGYFMDGLSNGTDRPAAARVARPSWNAKLATTGCAGEPIPLNTNVNLFCGARIYATTDYCTVSNMTNRWMVTKTITGDGPYFLPPRSDAALATNLIEAYDQVTKGWTSSVSSRDVKGEPEIFGSMFRAAPALWSGCDPEHLLRILPDWMRKVILCDKAERQPFTSEELALELTLLKAKSAEANAHDSNLFFRVDALECGHVTLEGLKSLLGAIPEECTEVVLSAFFVNIGETLFIGLLTFESDQAVAFAKKAKKELLSSLALCGVELVPGANVVSLVASNFLDIIAALAWVTDLKKAQDDVFRYAAYDCASFTLQSYNYAWIELNHVRTEYKDTDDDRVTTYEDDRFLWQTAAPDSPKDVLTTFSGNVFEAWWTGTFQVAYYTDGHMKVTFEPSTDRVSFDATDTTADNAEGERPTTIRITGKNIPRAYNTGLEGTSNKARVYRLSGAAVCENLTLFDYEYKNEYADYTSWISKCECTPDSTLTILIDYR